MKLILFTKTLKGLDAGEITRAARDLGIDGLDLAIRHGHIVNPYNVKEALPQAMQVWRNAGLCVPLATLEGSTTEPEAVESIFEACGQCGVSYIKLGYWIWKPDRHYWDEIASIRASLSKFQELGRKHGVCSLIHTHSDEYYGSNASGVMELVRGFDPQYIGVYLDPAHLSLDGEYFPMALDITRDYLQMVGVKNARYLSSDDGQSWKSDWCQLSHGLVDWPSTLTHLRQAGYDGFLSVHAEYSASEQEDEVLELVEKDIAYLKPYLNSI